MARRACTFKQQDVTRALKAASAAGAKVARIEIGKDGKIALLLDGQEAPPEFGGTTNEWDTVK